MVDTPPMFHSHTMDPSSPEIDAHSLPGRRRLEDPKFTSSWDKYHSHDDVEVWERSNPQKRSRNMEHFPTESEFTDISANYR